MFILLRSRVPPGARGMNGVAVYLDEVEIIERENAADIGVDAL